MIKILKYGEVPNSEIFARQEPTVNVADVVADILATVRRDGDKALFAYTEKFDKAKLDCLLVSPEERAEALAEIDPKFLEVLRRAAANIRRYHERQVRNSFILNEENGVDFQNVVSAATYYQCNYETGYYLAFYKEV